ncbi:Hepatitis A virus cellular receptor 1-like protein, partial [Camelus dromedarius]
MHPWVAIPGLILLLTNGVMSYVKVVGMVGQPVVLPCTYTGKAATMCWGRGPCPWSRCTAEMIWTNGYSVTYQQSPRYSLKGNIRSGNVSLTIDNPTVQDSGLYCCRIERKGWFNDRKLTISLEIKPDGNDTVTKSSGALQPNNQSPAVTVQSPWRTNNKGIYIGLCIAAIVLLVTILIVLLVRKYLCLGGKVELLRMISFKDSHFGALKNAAVKHVRAEDNVYIIEDS